MENISIKKTRAVAKTATTAKAKTRKTKTPTEAVSTNPFGVSFKGNIIQADVFEKSEKVKKTPKKASASFKAAPQTKMTKSAFVGSMNSFNEFMSSKFKSVAEFAQRTKEQVIALYKKAQDTKFHFDLSLELPTFAKVGERLSKLGKSVMEKLDPPDSVGNLSKLEVSELRKMMEELTA